MSNLSHTIRTFNRFELKYLLTLKQATLFKSALRAYLTPDEHGNGNGRYALASLYYDSPDYRCYWEKLDGCAPEDQPVIDEIYAFLWQYNLRPASIVRYERQAFIGTHYDLGLRVTFDTALTYQIYPLQGTDYVLATGRPVLYMGGFKGSDAAVSADDLAQMVSEGELRYVYLSGGNGTQSGVSSWVTSTCRRVEGFDTTTRNAGAPDGTTIGPNSTLDKSGDSQNITLYDCQNY